MFAAFSDQRLTNLVDLVEVRDGFKYPRVAGVYYRNLLSIRNGLSVKELYQRVGVDDCQYYQDSEGKWRVRFSYVGFKGEMFAVEAHAANGIIIVSQDRSI